jgi:hypothetical protein
MSETPRAQLIHIDVDRRLGHEWDEWDGRPLPNRGDYDSSPLLFFLWSAAALAAGLAVLALGLFLLGPRLATLHPAVPGVLWIGLGAAALVLLAWWGVLFLSWRSGRALLPERLAERGPFLRLMRLTSKVADRFGRRDWVENASVKVYNALALLRGRKVGKGEMLLLIPRCLSKETLDGVLSIAGRYGVPVFVATRGQLARRVPGAAPSRGGGGGLRAGHGERAARRGGEGAGARPHDDPAVWTLQGRGAQPGAAGGVGQSLRGLKAVKGER